ncbi:MAG TPA: hypothetical protein GX400_16630 [Chloroflexi bacterium]|nr:hypothetical protein [Chloroflexota bacterium]
MSVAMAMLVVWFVLYQFSDSPQPILAQTPAPEVGMHVARGDAAHMQAARAAGGRFVVVVFSWRDIEPVPNYLYWETPDATLRAADFAGIQVVARLDRPPQWALDAESPTPWDLDAYATFTQKVAARYGDRLAGVIVWNEPNLALEWHAETPSAADYAVMLQRVYPAIKAVAPELPVLAAGLAFTIGDDVTAVNDLAYLSALYDAGAGAYFDVLAAHPYGFGRPPAEDPAPDRLNFRRLELHRAIMEQNGDNDKPIWITEMGWRTSAPDFADRWQVVTLAQQRDYTLAALDLGATYPWLQRMALWELTAAEDDYGYALWQGEGRTTPAYDALAARNRASPPPSAVAHSAADDCLTTSTCAPVEILADDVIIRLGDRGELHPHWVHLHRGGERFSPAWEGEFFVDAAQASLPHTLMLETMQVDQPTNTVWVNNELVGLLRPRTRPDPTSTWVMQRIDLPAGILTGGRNTLRIESGQRNPTRTFRWWRWENFQICNIHVQVTGNNTTIANFSTTEAEALRWETLMSPPGWGEAIRLRAGASTADAAPVIWLTGNRTGQVWRGELMASDELSLQKMNAGAHPLVFTDVADDGDAQLAATNAGLFWRQNKGAWMPVDGAPPTYMHVVLHNADGWYAGAEGDGLWRADAAAGVWRRAALFGRTVLDLASDDSRLIAATDAGVYVRELGRWRRLPALPADQRSIADANFAPRVFIGKAGEIVVRSEARLLRWDEQGQAWLPFGPARLQGRLYTVLDCCTAGALVGGSHTGLWQLQPDEEWQRVDGAVFDYLEFSDAIRLDDQMIWATTNGVFAAQDDAPLDRLTSWRAVQGLPVTVTALLVDPADSTLWLAGTPTGVYRSLDAGASWQAISPPWVVWDMALGVDGRLYVATTGGVHSTAEVQRDPVVWRTAAGLEEVTFFTVSPDTTSADRFWAGTWGNDIGVSKDGGETIARLGAGLETLSILSILRHPTPGQFTVGTIEGLFRSDDDGASWFKLPGALTRQTVYALLQGDDGVLWAGAADGLWRSNDYGVTWQRINALAATTVIRLGRIDLPDGPLYWAGSEDAGLWLSRDLGATWRFGGLAGRSVYALAPAGEQWLAATDMGIAASSFSALLGALPLYQR